MVTAAAFKTRYPKFASVADETVQLYLNEAAAVVNSGDWVESDKDKATSLLAAHNLSSEGLGSSADAQFGDFKRLKIGSLELERAASVAASSNPSIFETTKYGREYLALMRSNFAGPLVV